jgi:tRNA N6-adenosine threonylcarbamoyltransferase
VVVIPLILAFETSCDETAVAVVQGTRSLSNVLSSQVDLHARFGGVVPEVAARAHVESIRSLTHLALKEAGVHPGDLDGVAATAGPGLVGALLVGHSFAKATAWARRLPFVGIDHMEGHLMAPRLQFDDLEPPMVSLLASGGHSQIVRVTDWGEYETMGSTIDDAAGEAFDKLARVMGLGFPGGPAIDLASEGGDPGAVQFPRALPDRPFHFSFSGLKTSVVTFIERAGESGDLPSQPDVAASVQEAIVDVLVDKTFAAVDQTGAQTVGGGGGVLANRRLRQRFTEEAAQRDITLALPDPVLCTDNAAMIGVAGAHWLSEGRITDWAENVNPGLVLGEPIS